MNGNRLSPRVTSAEFQVAYWPSGQPRPASSSFGLHRCSPSVHQSPGPMSCNTQHVNYTIILIIRLKWCNLVEEISAKNISMYTLRRNNSTVPWLTNTQIHAFYVCSWPSRYGSPHLLTQNHSWLCPPYLPFTHGRYVHLLMSGTIVSKWVPSFSKTSCIRIEANRQRK